MYTANVTCEIDVKWGKNIIKIKKTKQKQQQPGFVEKWHGKL